MLLLLISPPCRSVALILSWLHLLFLLRHVSLSHDVGSLRQPHPVEGVGVFHHAHSSKAGHEAVFRVHDDGREERLPSYEEALAHLAAVREALAITPGETATGAARRTAVALAQAREEIERLRGLILAFTKTARLKADADGWCNLVAEFPAFEALRQEPKGRVS